MTQISGIIGKNPGIALISPYGCVANRGHFRQSPTPYTLHICRDPQ